MRTFIWILSASFLLLSLLVTGVVAAHADSAGPQNGAPAITQEKADGPMIYASTCQACHMANARGATGAATIPALAGNPKLQGHGYPIYVVLYGHGAMPAFGGVLTDAQIAAVLNYVRQNFGNNFKTPILPPEVKAMRAPGKQYAGF
jgi:mono/diheme cytochrome c family protein